MPIQLRCSLCNNSSTFPDAEPGKTAIPCPVCFGLIPVPPAEAGTGEAWWVAPNPPQTPAANDPAKPNNPAGGWWTEAASKPPVVPVPPRPVEPTRLGSLPPTLPPQCSETANKVSQQTVLNRPPSEPTVLAQALPPALPSDTPDLRFPPALPKPPRPRRKVERADRILLGVGAGLALILLVWAPLVLRSPKKGTPKEPAPTRPLAENTQTQPIRTLPPERPIDPPPTLRLPVVEPEPMPQQPAREEKPQPRPEPERKVEAPLVVKNPEPPQVAKKPEPEAQPAPRKIVIKRRQTLSEEDLKKQILKAPEVALDLTAARKESKAIVALAHDPLGPRNRTELAALAMKDRADLKGLPIRMGDACKISPTAADHLQGGSVTLRGHLFASANLAASRVRVGATATADTRPDPEHVHKLLTTAKDRYNLWLKPEAIPALMQLLMAENEAIRLVLVDQLAGIEGPRASAALANRAIFDLCPDVRKAALEALAARPRGEYVQPLIEGLNYPWSVIADHAAEAIVALDLKEALPSVVRLLDTPDPETPRTRGGQVVVRELVRINHLRNCLMCHAPSLAADDKVRGFVPPTNQPLPPAFTQEYYAPKQEGIFVRADVTYLQQDFSVPLPVANHGLWPSAQRYDFMVRERTVGVLEPAWLAADRKPAEPTRHQKTLFYVLRNLTGDDPGPTAEDWKRLFASRDKVTLFCDGLQLTGGIAADGKGNVYVSDLFRGVLFRVDPNGKQTPLVERDGGFQAMAFDTARGRLLACQPNRDRIVAVDVSTGNVTVVLERTPEKPFGPPTYLAVDRRGGIYFSAAPNMVIPGDLGGLYYYSAVGTLTRLLPKLDRPRGLALSPSEGTLYVASGSSTDVFAVPLESAGSLGKPKVLGRLQSHLAQRPLVGEGLAVDPASGNVCVAHPVARGFQVFNPEGAKLTLVPLPDSPVFCMVSDKTLYVTTAKAVYRMKLEGPARGVVRRE